MMKKVALALGAFALLLVSFFGILKHYESGQYVEPSADSLKAKDGESPIRANGKLLVIDGGFAKSYQEKTGNAGYILTYNSNGLLLSQNKPFESVEKAIMAGFSSISFIFSK